MKNKKLQYALIALGVILIIAGIWSCTASKPTTNGKILSSGGNVDSSKTLVHKADTSNEKKSSTIPSFCHEVKIINGHTYTLAGIAGYPNGNWIAQYAPTIQGDIDQTIPITKEQAKEYMKKCGY